MQTKREYLTGLGLAKPGRGKFSNAAKQALEAARNSGITFSDDGITVPKVNRDKPKGTVAATGGMVEYKFQSEYRYPEAQFKAVAGRKVYSMREVCSNCHVSLVGCHCGSPAIIGGSINVRIMPK